MSNLIITRPPEFLDPWFIEIEQVWDEIEGSVNDIETRLLAAESSISTGLVTSVHKSGDPAITGNITLSAGTNVSLTQVGNNITVSTVALSSSLISDFNEASQDAVNSAFAAGTHDGVSVTYNDPANSLSLANLDKGTDAVTAHEGDADPHTQYLLADGTRDLTGNLAVDSGVTIDGRDISVDGVLLDTVDGTLNAHLNGDINKHDASEIDVEGTYANSASSPTDLETVLSEFDTAITNAGTVDSVFSRTGVVVAVAGDYTATQVTNTPAGNIAAVTVQAAINELDSEKAALSHTHVAADVTDFNEAAQDAMDSAFAAGTHTAITVTYNDAGNSFSLANTDRGSTAVTTHEAALDPHTQYTTTAEAAAAAPVQSVFTRTGAVVAVAGDYTATQITNTPAGNIAAVTVQAALNELDTEKSAVGHVHAASAITYSPYGNIAATNVQTAINELEDEKQERLFTTLFPSVTPSVNVSAINTAISDAQTAGGGQVLLQPGDWPIDATIEIDQTSNVKVFGLGGVVIQPQDGGTWIDGAVFHMSNPSTSTVAINNFSKGATSIFTTTAANASDILANEVLVVFGTDSTGVDDCTYYIAAANGNGGTGEIILTSPTIEAMTTVTLFAIEDYRDVVLSNMAIDASALTDTTSFKGIFMRQSAYAKIEDMKFFNFTTSGSQAIDMSESALNEFRNLRIYNVEQHGLALSNTTACYFENLEIDKTISGNAISLAANTTDNDFYDVRVRNISSIGFGSTTVAKMRRIYLSGYDAKRTVGASIHLRGARDSEFNGLTIEESNGEGIFLFSDNENNVFQGTISRCTYAVRASTSKKNTINMVIRNCTQDAVYLDNNCNSNIINGIANNCVRGLTLNDNCNLNMISMTIDTPNSGSHAVTITDSKDNDLSNMTITGLAGGGVDYSSTGTSARNKFNRLNYVTKTAAYSSLGEDLIYVDTSGGAVTITLSTADALKGKQIRIKDSAGSATTNNITIDTQGAELIDGAATYVMSANYEFLELACNGTNWFIVG